MQDFTHLVAAHPLWPYLIVLGALLVLSMAWDVVAHRREQAEREEREAKRLAERYREREG